MAKPAKLTRALAEDMAVAALTFIAQDGERLGRFLTLSGLEPGTLREAAAEPSFLVGVLDYLSSDESLLLAFAANFQIDPTALAHRPAASGGRGLSLTPPCIPFSPRIPLLCEGTHDQF